MVSNADALKKKIADLKEKVAKEFAAGKDSKKDPAFRTLRKELKRAQRRYALLTPLSLENQLKRSQKVLDLIGKELGEITKGEEGL